MSTEPHVDEESEVSEEELAATSDLLSGLHKMTAPQDFSADVEETIRRRSEGRFFGRRAFGDRVPFELMAMIALILGVIVFLLIRGSDTGSLQYKKDLSAPEISPEAQDQMPTPWPESSQP